LNVCWRYQHYLHREGYKQYLFNDCLNKDLKSVNTRLSSNKLTLNLTKTEFLTSRQRRVYLSDNPSLTINNFPIELVSSTKSLGVYVDENLSWNTHIESVCKKISSALGLIKLIRNLVPFHNRLNLSNGLVKPQFDYWFKWLGGANYDVLGF